MISRNFYYIKGFVGMARGKKNEIDIAVIKLEKETAKILARTYCYLTERDIMPNKNIKEETEHLIVGYPNSKTFVNLKKKKISSEPVVYIAISKNKSVYLKMGIDNTINTLLGYNRRKSSFVSENEMNISPVPDGISGCGLWYVTSYFTVEPIYKLVGIMTEYYSKTNIMMATKIELSIKMVELVH